MTNISAVTKRDIIDLFTKGITYETIIGNYTTYYSYYGRIRVVDFLKRIYDLSSMPSYDSRLKNAEEDIEKHIYFGDYSEEFIFDDERFNFKDQSDESFLRFLCEVFHPEVRDEKKDWKSFFNKINELLEKDGYEFYVSDKISERDVYSWRKYHKKPEEFIPFSERNKNLKINFSIPNKVREELCRTMIDFDETFIIKTITNLDIQKNVSELVIEEIYEKYTPKQILNGKYVEIKEFCNFFKATRPALVFDVIESFRRNISKERKDEFEKKINDIFRKSGLKVYLKNYYIFCNNEMVKIDSSVIIEEPGIEKLLGEAEKFYRNAQYNYAVEKMWDAFERLKTYYHPELDKKNSAKKIVDQVSFNNEDIKDLINSEFIYLTKIGNSYRIRHHEKDKIEIKNDLHYEYLYKRCLSLISVVIKVLNKD